MNSLLRNREDLSSIHVRKSVCQCMFVLSVLGRQKPEDGWGLLSSQSTYIGEPGTVRDPDLKTNIFNYMNNINES